MDIENIIKRDFKKVEKETKISKIVSKMKRGTEAVAVFDGKDFLGIISSNQIIDRDYPAETKAKTLVKKNIPKIESKVSPMEIAKIFLENNIKAIPIISKKEITGLLYENDFIRNSDCLSESKKLLKEIASIPHVIKKDENIGKARKILKENSISRLPVIDENKKMIGILDIEDFLKTVNPMEGMGWGDRTGDSMPEFKMPVTTIMDENPIITEDNITCNKIIKLFKKYDKSYIVFVREKKPLGIVTSKDILEVIVSMEKKEGVYVQINGLKEIEDNFQREKIDSMIVDSVQKIGKIHGPMEYFFVHIKSSQKEGEQKLFSVRTRMLTSVGLYVSKSSGWNIITTVDEALDRLERQVIEDREKMLDMRSPRNA